MRWRQGTCWMTALAICISAQVASGATKHESADVPKEITASGTVVSVLEINDSGAISDLTIELDISFLWDEDLDVYLIAPDDRRVELFTDVGGFGADFTQTVLDDAATVAIKDGTAPFTGRYQPEGKLSDLVGTDRQGTWKLEITNDGGWFDGLLNSWAIILGEEGGAEPCPPAPEPMNPDPADGATGVSTDTVLSWRLGAGAPTAFRFLAATGEEEPNPFSLFELQTDPPEAIRIDENCGVYGLDFSPDGELYACAEYALWRLTLTGDGVSCTKIGDFRSATDDSVLMTGLAFHPDGTLYGSTFDFLTTTSVIYTIDETTAFVTEVCRMSILDGLIWAIDFSPDGKLYAAFTDVTLVDLETCGIQRLATLLATDIDFAPDGFLYAIDSDSRTLYQIDPSLGIVIAEYGPYEIAPWGLASEILNGTTSASSASGAASVPIHALGETRPASSMRGFRAKLRRIGLEPGQIGGYDHAGSLKSYSAAVARMPRTVSISQDPDIVLYDVFLDTATPPTTLLCDDLQTRQCTASNLRPCTTYYWQVVAENGCGEQTDGPIWSFTTKGIPADFDEDCDVDLVDLAVFASYWLHGTK